MHRHIVIHKSSWKDWDSRTDWESIDEIREYHMTPSSEIWKSKDGFSKRGRSFNDVAYHYFILKDGTIQNGRKLGVAPASCKGHNRPEVIAICLQGEFIIEQPTAPQRASLLSLLYSLCKEYNMETDMHHIFGHCDYRDPPGNRHCPGKNLHRMIPLLAKEVNSLLHDERVELG